MNRYIPSQGLAQLVLFLLGGQIFLAICAMVSALLQVQLLTRALTPEGISDNDASLNDVREAAISILSVIVAIISGIISLRYLARANHNATALGAKGLSATPGWTIGYFFVPVVNLWRPYQIVQEIWKASAPDSYDWKLQLGSSLIGWWWGVRLFGIVMDRVAMSMVQVNGQGPTHVQRLIEGTWMSFVSEMVGVAGLVLAGLMIHQLQQRQVERFETLGEPKSQQCPACGEPLGMDLVFETNCPVCGTLVQPSPATQPG